MNVVQLHQFLSATAYFPAERRGDRSIGATKRATFSCAVTVLTVLRLFNFNT